MNVLTYYTKRGPRSHFPAWAAIIWWSRSTNIRPEKEQQIYIKITQCTRIVSAKAH